ncbi:MAG: type I-U CRISPR-associated protein Cas7, partial [bacterium]
MELDALLKKDGPVAIVLTERLRAVGGAQLPVFPPSYAAAKEDSRTQKSGYIVDEMPDKRLRCVLDSVQSQA